jgi:hypothetical protein
VKIKVGVNLSDIYNSISPKVTRVTLHVKKCNIQKREYTSTV